MSFTGIHPENVTGHQTVDERIDEADAYFHSGRYDLSEVAYRNLLDEFPLRADFHNSLGTVLDSQGRYLEAVAYYTKAVYLQADFITAHLNLANTLKRCGDMAGCLENLQVVVSVRPGCADAWQNLAACHFEAGWLEGAASCLERVIELDSNRISCYADLGDVYYRIGGELDKALMCFDTVLTAKPDFTPAYNSKGLVLHEIGDYAGAEACYRRILALEPDNSCTMNNLGLTLLARAEPLAAIEWYKRALELKPDDPSTNFNKGIALLLLGDYKQGWEGYEQRFDKLDPVYIPRLDLSCWNGEMLDGKTLLVRSEQGYGDCIQFARYLPLLSKYGGKIILECIDDLIKPLFVGLSGIDSLLTRGDPSPPIDLQIPIASLPGLFDTDLKSIPFPGGYLNSGHPESAGWRDLIDNEAEGFDLKVGVVWGGRKTRLNADRSLTLPELTPLFEIQGIKWYSLQTGEDAAQIETHNKRLVDLGMRIISFADTAAIMRNLDMVITVDTAVAHLAGAMGVPAWVLLKSSPDWRWMLERTDSPWYDSLRLFRQQTGGKWASVVFSVADAAKKWVCQQKKLKSKKQSPIG